MSTSRVRNYVAKNGERVEGWMRKAVVRLLSYKIVADQIEAGNLQEEERFEHLDVKHLVKNVRQSGICMDVLSQHYQVAFDGCRGIAIPNIEGIEKLFEGKERYPELAIALDSCITEESLYTNLSEMEPEEVYYVYKHQDQFSYKIRQYWWGYHYSKRRGLLVVPYDKVGDIKTIAFRNGVLSMYNRNIQLIGRELLGISTDYVSKMSDDDGSVYNDHKVNVWLRSIIPTSVGELTEETIESVIEDSEKVYSHVGNMIEELKAILSLVRESGGDERFKEKVTAKAIDVFYGKLPLYVNSTDDFVKRLAKKALEKNYRIK